MKIGIVSNSVMLCKPLLLYLYHYKNKTGLVLYIGKSGEPHQNFQDLAAFCYAQGIALNFESNQNDLYNWQQLHQPDIVFFAGYTSTVKTSGFGDTRYGIYNIHFGRLPQFRGPSPVFWQLKNGVKELGLSIHQMTDKMDSGPVVWRYTITSQPHFNFDYVNQLFAQMQVNGVVELLENIHKDKPLTEIPQNENKAAYYKRPQLKDVMINWDEMDCEEIINLIRACNSWNAGASALINNAELKILDATPGDEPAAPQLPGTITITETDPASFSVACKDNQLLRIKFFKMNNCFSPARFAAAYGLKTGHRFVSDITKINTL
jgi:methionyl-tRNA formyltransferase